MFDKIKEVIKSFIEDADEESTKDNHKDEQGFSPSIGDSIWGNSLAHVHEMGAVVTFKEEVEEEEGLYLYRFIDKEGMEECYGKMCDGEEDIQYDLTHFKEKLRELEYLDG